MCSNQHMSSRANSKQIIKERLAFPSGTATAQLIAVLHKLPPPTEPNVNPGEYLPLNADEGHPEDHSSTPGESLGLPPSPPSQSWRSLTWSLILSAFLTVCHPCLPTLAWLADICSLLLTSFPCYFPSRSLAPTSPGNGCGPLLPAYLTSDKVRSAVAALSNV